MLGSRRGAPRSEKARLAILEAVSVLFQQRGYEQLTIEGVAHEAGVSKQTIYRWWSTKSDLVAECLLEGHLFPGQLTLPDTGDLHADLIDWVDQVIDLIQEPAGRSLVTSLVAAATENEKIGARLRESLGGTDSVIYRLQAGVKVGQLPPDTALEELSEALAGTLLLKAISGGDTSSGSGKRLINALLR